MNELRKHRLLLSLVAFLILMKFVVVPIFEWQDSQVQLLAAQQKKINKAAYLLANTDKLIQENTALQAQITLAEQLIFPYQDESVFKLARQQQIEKILNRHDLAVKNIGWQQKSPLQATELIQYQISVFFSGDFVNAVAMLAELENTSPWLHIDNFNLVAKSTQPNIPVRSKGSRVLISVYMMAAKNSNTITP